MSNSTLEERARELAQNLCVFANVPLERIDQERILAFAREERRLERERCLEQTAEDGYDCNCYDSIRALGDEE